MGDPRAEPPAPIGASNGVTINEGDRRILDFFKHGPQRVEVMSLIEQVQGNSLNLVLPSGNIFSMESQNSNHASTSTSSNMILNANEISTSNVATSSDSDAVGRKRGREVSPTIPSTTAIVATASTSFAQANRQGAVSTAQVESQPTSKRLAVIIDSNMPADVKNCRRSLIEAVKKAGPEGMIFEEIKTIRNSDILITCTSEHDHNICRKMSSWKQVPFTMSPRFNIATESKSILYIKRVDKRVPLEAFKEALDLKLIGYTDLERVCVGKDRKETFTLRLVVPLENHKAYLLKFGLLVDHMKYVFEPHVRTNLRQCFHCQRFGHLAADCTAEKRCVRCGEAHSHKDCDKEQDAVKCGNCAGPHAASDRSCPTRLGVINVHRRNIIQGKEQAPAVRPKIPARIPRADDIVVNRSRQESIRGRAASTFAGKVAGENQASHAEPTRPVGDRGNSREVNDAKTEEFMGVLVDSIEDVLGLEGGSLADAVLRCVGRRNCKYIDAAALARNFLGKNINTNRNLSSNTAESVRGQERRTERPSRESAAEEISLSVRNYPGVDSFGANQRQSPTQGRYAFIQRSKSRKTSTSSKGSVNSGTSALSQVESDGGSFLHGRDWSSLAGAEEAMASPCNFSMSDSFRTPIRQGSSPLTLQANASVETAATVVKTKATIPTTTNPIATATSIAASAAVLGVTQPIFTGIAECLAASIGYSEMIRDQGGAKSSTPQRILPPVPRDTGEKMQMDQVQTSATQLAVGGPAQKGVPPQLGTVEAASLGQLTNGPDPKERRRKTNPSKEDGE